MKLKTSQKLNDMMTELYNIDYAFVDNILCSYADYYTVNDKSTGEDGVEGGIFLFNLSLKKKKPVYHVYCYQGNFSAYFVNTLSELKKIMSTNVKIAIDSKGK